MLLEYRHALGRLRRAGKQVEQTGWNV